MYRHHGERGILPPETFDTLLHRAFAAHYGSAPPIYPYRYRSGKAYCKRWEGRGGTHPWRWSLVMILGGCHGLRPCEMERLTWGDCFRPRGETILVRAKRVHGNKPVPQSVWLLPATSQALAHAWYLAGRPGNNTAVLRSYSTRAAPNAPVSSKLIRETIRNYFHAFGYKRLNPYSLRRSFAARLWYAGASPAEIQQELRHASLHTTLAYLQNVPQARTLYRILPTTPGNLHNLERPPLNSPEHKTPATAAPSLQNRAKNLLQKEKNRTPPG